MIELYLKPEGLQFGLDRSTDGTWQKDVEVVVQKTATRKGLKKLTVSVPMSNAGLRIIDIADLETQMANVQPSGSSFDPADFGMQMFEGSSKGRFIRGGA